MLTVVDRLAYRSEMRIEAAVEPDHQRRARFPHHREAFFDPLHIEIDRLLAEDRLAGAGEALDQVGMGVGRRADDDRIDIRGLLDLVDGANLAAMRCGKILGRLFKGIGDGNEFRLRGSTSPPWREPCRYGPHRADQNEQSFLTS